MPAKKKTTRRRATNPSRKPLPGWIWMLTGLVIGLSATLLPTLNEQYETVESEVEEKSPPEPKTKRTFDFYTLLPELEVVVDQNTSQQASPNKVPTDKPKTGNYILQVGSFKSDQEADSLKAQLALIGVVTNIEVVNVNGVKWHRVRIGPSQDLTNLESIQKRLRSEKIDSIMLKVRS